MLNVSVQINYGHFARALKTIVFSLSVVQLQVNLSTTATLGTKESGFVERWLLWEGRGVI